MDAINALEKLTTSSQSLADYFKNKLAQKGKPTLSSTSEPASKIANSTRSEVDGDGDMMPRLGLGARRTQVPL